MLNYRRARFLYHIFFSEATPMISGSVLCRSISCHGIFQDFPSSNTQSPWKTSAEAKVPLQQRWWQRSQCDTWKIRMKHAGQCFLGHFQVRVGMSLLVGVIKWIFGMLTYCWNLFWDDPNDINLGVELTRFRLFLRQKPGIQHPCLLGFGSPDAPWFLFGSPTVCYWKISSYSIYICYSTAKRYIPRRQLRWIMLHLDSGLGGAPWTNPLQGFHPSNHGIHELSRGPFVRGSEVITLEPPLSHSQHCKNSFWDTQPGNLSHGYWKWPWK